MEAVPFCPDGRPGGRFRRGAAALASPVEYMIGKTGGAAHAPGNFR